MGTVAVASELLLCPHCAEVPDASPLVTCALGSHCELCCPALLRWLSFCQQNICEQSMKSQHISQCGQLPPCLGPIALKPKLMFPSTKPFVKCLKSVYVTESCIHENHYRSSPNYINGNPTSSVLYMLLPMLCGSWDWT